MERLGVCGEEGENVNHETVGIGSIQGLFLVVFTILLSGRRGSTLSCGGNQEQ